MRRGGFKRKLGQSPWMPSKAILTGSTVPIARQVEELSPELVVVLLPSLVRTMLAAFVEVMAEQQGATA